MDAKHSEIGELWSVKCNCDLFAVALLVVIHFILMEETLDLEFTNFEEPSNVNPNMTDFGVTVIKSEQSYAQIEPEDLHIETNDLEDPVKHDFDDTLQEEETKDFIKYSENMQMFETDIGCLATIAVSPKYKEFAVKEPMKNGTFITY